MSELVKLLFCFTFSFSLSFALCFSLSLNLRKSAKSVDRFELLALCAMRPALNVFFNHHPHKHRIRLSIPLPHPPRLPVNPVAPLQPSFLHPYRRPLSSASDNVKTPAHTHSERDLHDRHPAIKKLLFHVRRKANKKHVRSAVADHFRNS